MPRQEQRQPHRPSQPRTKSYWSDRAAYAPGYPRRDLDDGRLYSSSRPLWQEEYRVPPPPRGSFARPPSPPLQRHALFRVHMPKKQVHFDLPSRNASHKHAPRAVNRPDVRRPDTPVHAHQRSNWPDPREHHLLQPQPQPHLDRRPSYSTLRRQPSRNLHLHTSYAPLPPPKSKTPTIHLVTYAISRTPHTLDILGLLSTYLPQDTPHLYTIRAFNFTPPPRHLCALYSGVSPIVQDAVMADPRARKAVALAVDELVWFGRRERRKGEGGRKDVALSVCCEHGTHRSVGVAEEIAREMRGLGAGVRVRVVHVHRVRGERDLY